MSDLKKTINKYYANKESLWGYTFIMHDSKHFGYYPQDKVGLTEKDAQHNYQELVAKNLGLKPGEHILDAGCGRGVMACYLAKAYDVNVTGIDLVDFEIEKAKNKARQLGISDKVNFFVGDYSTTGLNNNSFDAVYTNETLSHSPDLGKAFGEFYRILKPGGKISLFEYVLANDEEFTERDRNMIGFIIKYSGMAGLKQFRKKSIEPILSRNGFRDYQEQDITSEMKPSFLRLHKLLRPLYPLVKLFGLQAVFINTTSAVELHPLVEKNLISYYIYTARKPTLDPGD